MSIEFIYENTKKRIIDLISKAKLSIKISVNEISDHTIINVLNSRFKSVNLKVLTYFSSEASELQLGLLILKEKGVLHNVIDGSLLLSHNNYIVIDNKITVVGNFNLANNSNDSFFVVIRDDSAVAKSFMQGIDAVKNPKDNDVDFIVNQLSVESLKYQIAGIVSEITEQEKILGFYEQEFNSTLLESMVRIKKLQIEKLTRDTRLNSKLKNKLKETEDELDDLLGNVNVGVKQKKYLLNNKERLELKKIFRKASKICFPDLVAPDQQEEAEEIFRELQMAYKNMDLETVSEIYSNLKTGILAGIGQEVGETKYLKSLALTLLIRRNSQYEKFTELYYSETYASLKNIDNVKDYFESAKKKFEADINRLESELKTNYN